jgi:ribosomal protein S18 acetylase RimI-like enzyme
MVDIGEYEALARETGVYKDIEIEILKESLSSWEKRPNEPYTVLEIRDGKILAAFLVLLHEEDSDYSYTIQTICVDPSYRETGVVDKLLDGLEIESLKLRPSAILRFELSTEKERALGLGVLESRGYGLIGHIPDFYAKGSDYFMYAKIIHRRNPGERGEE